jgi:nuclear transport factor 2 (NTF2) superfamily protein
MEQSRSREGCAAYSVDSVWRNRVEFPKGREEIIQFLATKWARGNAIVGCSNGWKSICSHRPVTKA